MVRILPISTEDLKQAVHATAVRGDGELIITEIGEPLAVGPGGVAFIIAERFLDDIPLTKASVLVIQSAFAGKVAGRLPASVKICIECDDAYVGLANFTKKIRDMDPLSDWHSAGAADVAVHPTATVDPTARLSPGVMVGAGASIGAGTSILGNTVIGPAVHIGRNCTIFPGVVLYPRTTIGDRVRIHANAVLGSDGFGYAPSARGSVKIWHLGKLAVGDNVEIGAGSTIDRGTIKDTIIENDVKIDNLVHIGHNVHIKAHAILCAQVGIAGNVTVGTAAILGGQVAVADKIEIGDRAMVGPTSGVINDVKPGEKVMGGQRALPQRDWRRLTVLFEKLPELYRRVKKLEAQDDTKPDLLRKSDVASFGRTKPPQ